MDEKVQKLIEAGKHLIVCVEDSIGIDLTIEETQEIFRNLGSAVSSLEIAIYDIEQGEK